MDQGINGTDKGGAGRAQFADALTRNLFEQFFAARKQRYEHAPAVVTATLTPRVAVNFKPVDQFDDAVMFQGKAFRQGSNGGFRTFGHTANGQQNKVLLWFEARGVRCRIAFPYKMANAIA
jgi:hypothetical protein